MEEQEFLKNIKRVSEHRKYKVTNSWGVYDGYKWYRKNKPKDKKYVLSESQYFAIIRHVNEGLRNSLIEGNDIVLPEKMGRIEVRKYSPSIYIKEGKVVANLPINWDATLKLWYEDPQAYKERFLVKVKEPELFKVFYNRALANYNNKTFYQLLPNRELKLMLKRTIKNTGFEAFKK